MCFWKISESDVLLSTCTYTQVTQHTGYMTRGTQSGYQIYFILNRGVRRWTFAEFLREAAGDTNAALKSWLDAPLERQTTNRGLGRIGTGSLAATLAIEIKQERFRVLLILTVIDSVRLLMVIFCD